MHSMEIGRERGKKPSLRSTEPIINPRWEKHQGIWRDGWRYIYIYIYI